jgi:acetyltransferase
LAMRFPESKQDNLVDPALIAAEKPAESGSRLAACFASQFTMKDGTVLTFRLIRPEDEPLMANFQQTLSARSVYMRYFCSLSLQSRVGHERLVRVCHADGDRETALVVDRRDKATGQHQILGVGRLTILNPQNEAEVAILVSDQYQRQGLGTELLRRLVQIARDQKRSRVVGELLRDNLAMQALLKKLGFRFRLRPDSPALTAFLEG